MEKKSDTKKKILSLIITVVILSAGIFVIKLGSNYFTDRWSENKTNRNAEITELRNKVESTNDTSWIKDS